MIHELAPWSPQDRSRISLERDYEIAFWTQTLGANHSVLEEAIAALGSDAERVRQYLASGS